MASRNLKILNLELQGGYRYVALMVSVVNAFRCKRLLCALFWVIYTYPLMDMEPTECSETLEFQTTDAGESLRRKNTTFRTWQRFEIRKSKRLLWKSHCDKKNAVMFRNMADIVRECTS
jgi:hypothetical protein